ncbi:MAG: hypothetical protein IKU98_04950 [Bacteroidaceae bacterium]|nr:hypothetical protein [Bacteroidaceae bacterium]
MKNIYQVAGHRFGVVGEKLCRAVARIDGFKPFLVNGGEVLFSFVEDDEVPEMKQVQYEFAYEDVVGTFGKSAQGFMLTLKPAAESAFYLWHNDAEKEVKMNGNWSVRLYRFAMWVGLGLMVAPYDTVAIHSSCITYRDKAVLFLGESGTGKSTHTRLWREHIKGALLLNDDSPFIRVEDGKVWAYGSPWSGKTPCYKQERYELKGCVRLSQAPFNQIKRLSVLQAYGAIHPSCPPEFAYDDVLYDCISHFIDKLLSSVSFYHLACLPDAEAAMLSCQTIFSDEADSQ